MQKDGPGGAGVLHGIHIGGRCVVPPKKKLGDGGEDIVRNIADLFWPDLPPTQLGVGSKICQCTQE